MQSIFVRVQSAHENFDNKIPIGFLGLSCCWLYLFSLPIQEKLVQPKPIRTCQGFYFFSEGKFHFPLLAAWKTMCWGSQVLPAQLSVLVFHWKVLAERQCLASFAPPLKEDITVGIYSVFTQETCRQQSVTVHPLRFKGRFRVSFDIVIIKSEDKSYRNRWGKNSAW